MCIREVVLIFLDARHWRLSVWEKQAVGSVLCKGVPLGRLRLFSFSKAVADAFKTAAALPLLSMPLLLI